MPHQPPAGFRLRRSSETSFYHPFHGRNLVLAENELLKLLILLRKEDVILQQGQDMLLALRASCRRWGQAVKS